MQIALHSPNFKRFRRRIISMKRMNSLYLSVSFIMLCLLLSGCASKRVAGPDTLPASKKKGLLVVVLPHENIGAIVDMPQPSVLQICTAEMKKNIPPRMWGKVFSDQEVAQAMKQQTVYAEGSELAVNLAKTLNASFLVLAEAEITTGKSVGGAIASGIMSGLTGKKTAGSPIPHYVSGAKFTYQAYIDNTASFEGEATLQITLHVIEVASGQAVYKGQVDGTTKTRLSKMPEEFARPMSVIKSYEPAKALWIDASKKAAKKAAADLKQNWAYIFRLPGEVQQVNSKEVVISLGKSAGLTKGTMLAAFNPDDSQYQNPLAFLKASKLQANSSIAKLEKGASINRIQSGMAVIPCQMELFTDEE
jgi:hypothetical protein